MTYSIKRTFYSSSQRIGGTLFEKRLVVKRGKHGEAVLLFLEDGMYEEAFRAVAWNKFFMHLSIKDKGVRLKIRLDTVRKDSAYNAVRPSRRI